MSSIQIGSIVRLKSGGPAMVVANTETGFFSKVTTVCCCRWIDNPNPDISEVKYVYLREDIVELCLPDKY